MGSLRTGSTRPQRAERQGANRRRPGRKRIHPIKPPRDPNAAPPKRGGPRPGAGRPRGSFKIVENQEELAIMCRKAAPELFEEIYWLATRSKDQMVRLSAIREIFDRGFGRPKQVQVFQGALTITHEEAIRELNRRLEHPFPEDAVENTGAALPPLIEAAANGNGEGETE